ncbi:MAG: lycopene cyclase domain-containing protein [Flavobacteriales bacterium]|nr:lycopene cyclase domain-containing protein [Flavobacteriales bacterium]
MEKFYYLFVNLSCVAIPLLASFHPRIKFYRNWRAAFVAMLCTMLVFIPWDIAFTTSGVWAFNPRYTIGIGIWGLPLEEWLFFVCIPYACVFTYHCFSIFLSRQPLRKFANGIAYTIAFGFLLIAFTNTDRAYTFWAHLGCGVLLLLHLFKIRNNYLGRFFFMYLIILVPFIISNGVLTGLDFWQYDFINTNVDAIADQVVWYNNDENLRLRIFSMPVDDLAYGMLMLLMNVTIYEWMMPCNGSATSLR